MTLQGCDISSHQSTTPNLSAYAFVFCRAAYGTAIDTMYAKHSAAVRGQGSTLGAYTFGRSAHYVPIADQVAVLLSVGKDADLLALDVEQDTDAGGHPLPYSMTGFEAGEFITAVHAAGKTIGLYHSTSGYPTVGQDWRWVAAWGRTPPPIPWDFWQFRGSPLDLDAFNGDQAALDALVAKDGDMPMTSPVPDGPAAYLVDVAAGGSAYYQLNGPDYAKPNPMLALPGVVTYGTAKRADGILMRAIAHPSGFITWVGDNKCSNVRPKTPPPAVQTVTVTGSGIKIAGPV